MKENRNDPRLGPLVIRAWARLANATREGYLTNVSKSGAFLAIESPPEPGEELFLIAVLPWDLGELKARVRVAWTRSDAGPITGAGLQFLTLEEGSRERLESYLRRFLTLAASLEP